MSQGVAKDDLIYCISLVKNGLSQGTFNGLFVLRTDIKIPVNQVDRLAEVCRSLLGPI